MPKTGELVSEIVGPLRVTPHGFRNYIVLEDIFSKEQYWITVKTFGKMASLLKGGEFPKGIEWQWECRGGRNWVIRPSFLATRRKSDPIVKGFIRRLTNGELLFQRDWDRNENLKMTEVPKNIKANFKLTGRITSKRNTYLYYKAIECSEKQLENVCILFILDHILEKFDMSVPKEFKSEVELKKKTWIRGIIKTDQIETWTHIEHAPKKI